MQPLSNFIRNTHDLGADIHPTKDERVLHIHSLYNPTSPDFHRYVFMTQPTSGYDEVYIEERRGLKENAVVVSTRQVSIPKDKNWEYVGLPTEAYTYTMVTRRWEKADYGRALWTYLVHKGWAMMPGECIDAREPNGDSIPSRNTPSQTP